MAFARSLTYWKTILFTFIAHIHNLKMSKNTTAIIEKLIETIPLLYISSSVFWPLLQYSKPILYASAN